MRLCSIGPVLLALATLTGGARGQNYVFGSNVRVNDDPPGSSFHCLYSPGMHTIAARGDTVYIVWRDHRDDYSHIYFSRSINAGQTFSANVRVDNTPPECEGIMPSMVVDDSGRIHVSWLNYNRSGMRFVYYAKSIDGGLSFLAPTRACDSLVVDQYASPSIAVGRSGRHVYVVRSEANFMPYQPYRILLSRSTDGGQTFLRPDIRVSPETGVLWPSVAVLFDTIVLAAWFRTDSDFVSVARSTDEGVTFDPPTCLGPGCDPSLSIDDSRRAYLLSDGPVFMMSPNAGDSFGSRKWLPSPNGGLEPSLWASRAGKLYAAYWYYGDADDVRFVFSPNAGDTFFPPVDPSDAPQGTNETWVAVAANEAGKVFIAWNDNRNCSPPNNDYDVYCATGSMVGVQETPDRSGPSIDCELTPNPARGEVRISYTLERPGPVTARVFDNAGRMVVALPARRDYLGKHSLYWNGQDGQGNRSASGVYFVVLETPEGTRSRKFEFMSE